MSTMMKLFRAGLAAVTVGAALALAASAPAATSTKYHGTFVEIGGVTSGGSCGSATISELGHVAYQCVAFDACGPNCEVRTVTFDDGTLVMHESIIGTVSPGQSSAAGANAPLYFDITQTIVGGSGRYAGATGGGTGRVNLAPGALITVSGTITLQ